MPYFPDGYRKPYPICQPIVHFSKGMALLILILTTYKAIRVTIHLNFCEEDRRDLIVEVPLTRIVHRITTRVELNSLLDKKAVHTSRVLLITSLTPPPLGGRRGAWLIRGTDPTTSEQHNA